MRVLKKTGVILICLVVIVSALAYSAYKNLPGLDYGQITSTISSIAGPSFFSQFLYKSSPLDNNQPTAPPSLSVISPDDLTTAINDSRSQQKLNVLKSNSQLKTVAEGKITSIMLEQDWDKASKTEDLVKKIKYPYQMIGEAYYFATQENTTQVVDYWQENAKDVIFSPQFKEMGIATASGEFQGQQGTMIGVILGKKFIPTPTPTPVVITEADLWKALGEYRKDHGSNTLTLDENLCRYARQRTQELITRLNTLKPGDTPLDNHAGFIRDTDSGLAFQITGFDVLAEDLAYYPAAQNAVQVIEWGWDSSPKHKASLLANDVSHGCVTGIPPIFVAELGRH
jgi:uncharacterized protein YkwD